MHDSELVILRDRLASIENALDRLDSPAPQPEPILVQTTTESSYPSAAGHYFACTPLDAGGAESEGSAVTTTSVAVTVYVAVLGSTKPPSGTKLLAFPCGGRLVAVYNG